MASEKLIVPDELVKGVWLRLEERTGKNTLLELQLDLEDFYASDSFIWVTDFLKEYEVPSTSTLSRLVGPERSVHYVAIKTSGHPDSSAKYQTLNLLCYYAFGRSWKETLADLGKLESEIPRLKSDEATSEKETSSGGITETELESLRGMFANNPVESEEKDKPENKVIASTQVYNKRLALIVSAGVVLAVLFGIYLPKYLNQRHKDFQKGLVMNEYVNLITKPIISTFLCTGPISDSPHNNLYSINERIKGNWTSPDIYYLLKDGKIISGRDINSYKDLPLGTIVLFKTYYYRFQDTNMIKHMGKDFLVFDNYSYSLSQENMLKLDTVAKEFSNGYNSVVVSLYGTRISGEKFAMRRFHSIMRYMMYRENIYPANFIFAYKSADDSYSNTVLFTLMPSVMNN